jgi:Potential Queuosine, Q, salvage protein family
MDELRAACAEVATRARWVRIEHEVIAAYAAGLDIPTRARVIPCDPAAREIRAAFWLTLDAVNFGSGWFPTLRKRDGRSGYHTIAAGLRERFEDRGPWTAAQLIQVDAATAAEVFAQGPQHELMALFAASLRDLGQHLAAEHGGHFTTLVDAAGGSAVTLARHLGGWSSFADCSRYQELEVPFLKRAQIAAADLHRAGVAAFGDLDRLTLFADNLVPHVLRLDGVLRFDPGLVGRIDAGELIEHDSLEEIEIRACALQAVELITAARPQARAADIDEILWQRGGQPHYKASPRHRSRCTAY